MVSCDESSLVYVVPPDFADAGVVARDDAGFLAAPAGPREAGAPLALPVGLASLSQQVSPGVTESSSRVGLALPTARRRGAGGLDAGLSGACLSRACLGRRASAVASSVKGRVGGRVGGQRGERSRADPTKIGHKWTILTPGRDELETHLWAMSRAMSYRSPRAADARVTTNPSSGSPFPRLGSGSYVVGRVGLDCQTDNFLAMLSVSK